MLRAIIIDDEQSSINALKAMVEKYTKGLKIIADTTDPEKGVEIIEDYQPDVLFLDISMPKKTGFQLLEEVQYKEFKLVFITAHQHYAIKAIKMNATDYLLKPFDVEELKLCVEGLKGNKAQNDYSKQSFNHKIIEISVKDGILFIRQQEIIRLEASGSYTTFYMDNNVKHVASKNLKECEAMLSADFFYRCHSSHIINLLKVDRIISTDGLFAKMSDGSTPEIARKNKDEFLEKLKSIG